MYIRVMPYQMKINFRVSQVTNLDPEVINGLIQLELRDKRYDVLEVTNNSVRFYDNPWVFRWSGQQIMRLDGGIFKIDTSDNCISVTLNYYFRLWSLVGISIPVIGTIIEGVYEGTIFFVIVIAIAMFIQTNISKGVATDMLTKILNEDVIK